MSRASRAAKFVLDVGISFSALLFLAPLLLLAAAAIKLDSPGPVLFRQRRTGLDGRVFWIRKFRTMRVMEDDAVSHATRNDSRVTRVGAFLRRSSIDELPQLLNVLRGEMSLVGPRPHALAHDEYYGALIPAYTCRFRAKPGLTGLAQVSGHRGEVQDLQGMIDRVEADNRYIDTWSLRLDMAILWRTVRQLMSDPQAY